MPATPQRPPRTFRRLAAFAGPHVAHLLLALAMLGVTIIAETLVIPVLFAALLVSVVGPGALEGQASGMSFFHIDLAALIDRVVGSADRTSVLAALAVSGVLVMLVKSLAQTARAFESYKFSFLVVRDLRTRVFGHLLGQSRDFFEGTRTGSLLSRLTADTYILQEHLGPPLLEIVQAPLTIAVALGVLLTLNWRLTLATLCAAPLVMLFIAWTGAWIRRLTIARQDQLARLNAHLAERLDGVRHVQVFGRESDELAAMQALDRSYFREALRLVRLAELMSPASEFVVAIGMLTGLFLGGLSVLRGSMPREHFVLFFAVAPAATTQLSRLARIGQFRQQIAGAAAPLMALLDTTPSIADRPGARALHRVAGCVRFEGVCFAYPTGNEILHDVTLDIPAGTTLAIVGPSGAGKTTLVNLLPRLFDPTRGRILLDGLDVRHVTLASLRATIGLVSQEAVLFSHTIAENIRYGRPNATDAEVREAARAANALEFIEQLPAGWDTVVGEHGHALSGGQRQRVAIARALLRDPRILILDEATSSLDTETEQLIQDAVERVIVGRTTLVIAHRLSTVRRASQIVVLDGGRVIEQGSHEALLRRSGLYRRLHDAQFRS